MKADGIGPGQIIRRKQDGSLEYERDELTIEEPLEIRIGDKTVATTTQALCRFDVNASGRIDAGDVTVTRNNTVTVLP